jgi:hypothetical protein
MFDKAYLLHLAALEREAQENGPQPGVRRPATSVGFQS